MTTLTHAGARRAFLRLTGSRSLLIPRADRPASRLATRAGRSWLRFSLLPAAVDSRATRPALSTSARLRGTRVVEVAWLLAAAAGSVALLSALCR